MCHAPTNSDPYLVHNVYIIIDINYVKKLSKHGKTKEKLDFYTIFVIIIP